MEKRKTVCPLDCPDACSMIATLENGEITRVDGDPEHPFTQGFLCKKTRTYHHRVQSSERVMFPQHRVGKKGEGKFERISWDAAWQTLVSRLTDIKNQHGGEALLPYSYAGNMGLINRVAGDPFFYKFGASRLLQTICSSASKAGWDMHYGSHPGSPPEKAADADLIIAWGINVKVTNIHFMPLIVEAKRRGGKFVVIDPYLNSTAKSADYYFPVQPGGDTALALGLMKILLENGAVDRDFIAHHTEGFDEIAAYLMRLNLDECSSISGLSLEQINALASRLSGTRKTFIRMGIGLSRNTQGAMSVRAISCLAAALGLFDGGRGRGALLSSGSFSGDSARLKYPSLQETKTREVNMVQLGHALTELTPPLKSLFVYNSNPLSVAPDTSRVRAGLEREDLFTVVHEQFVTPTAKYADLLLPATTSFENHDLYTGYGHFYLQRVEPIVAEKGEAISNFELFQKLAVKMGYTDAAFGQTVNERIEHFVESMKGIPEEQQKRGILPGQAVRSEMMDSGGNYSKFRNKRFRFSVKPPTPDVPCIPCILKREELDDFDLKSRFPLKAITPPMPDLLNSTFGERYPNETGMVLIHPRDAKLRRITDGMLVEIYNGRGRNLRKADVSDRTQPGLLVLEGVYWENNSSGMTGVNELTSQKTTDLGKGGTFHEMRVDVREAVMS